MNKKTNPGDVALVAGTTYKIVGVDRTPDPDWYQVAVEGASPQQRWVAGACGNATINGSSGQGSGQGGAKNSGQCSIAGLDDSYVFAVSWQPAFCESHPDKPECAVTDPNAYQAKNFTLHGLWPNKSSCGTDYGFCGKQQQEKGSFCNYPQVGLTPSVFQKLGVVMPSAAAGSCLQRHEWYKHGTCQTEWDNDGYFSVAIDFVHQFNDSGMSAFMTKNIGHLVKKEDLLAQIDKDLGNGASERMKIMCDGANNLVDIYINLPKKIVQGDKLRSLIQQGEKGPEYKCPPEFKVDAIGQ
jgi:ribonuclease T2